MMPQHYFQQSAWHFIQYSQNGKSYAAVNILISSEHTQEYHYQSLGLHCQINQFKKRLIIDRSKQCSYARRSRLVKNLVKNILGKSLWLPPSNKISFLVKHSLFTLFRPFKQLTSPSALSHTSTPPLYNTNNSCVFLPGAKATFLIPPLLAATTLDCLMRVLE